ncbi:MAG: YfhO family protein [Thermoanaerobaculia bacterium]
MNLTFAWVGLLYAAFVWIAKRLGAKIPGRVALLFYLLVLVFLYKPMTQDFVNVPADYLFRGFPWHGVEAVKRAQNPEINDVILQMVPWAHQVREAWSAGELPVWNNFAGGGYPLAANGQSAAFSILRLLSFPLNLGNSFTCEAALKLLAALTFAYLYMKRRESSELASLITAISYGFSTFLIVWLHFPHASVAAFLPALFYAIDLVLERVTYRRFLLTAAVFTMLLLNGHPESAAHIVFVSILYVLFRAAMMTEQKRLPALLTLVAAGVTSLLLSQMFMLHFIKTIDTTQRIQKLAEYDYLNFGVDWRLFVNFWAVDFYGLEKDKTIWGPGIAETVCGYAGVLGIAGWVALLIDLVRRRQWRSTRAFYALVTPFIVLIALSWPVIGPAFHKLPLFSLAANGRLRLAICWFVAVMAGMLIDLAVKERQRYTALAGVVVGFVLMLLPFALHDFPKPEARDLAIASVVPGLFVLAFAARAIFQKRSRPELAGMLLLAAIGVELFRFGLNWNPVVPAEKLFPVTPAVEMLQRLQNEPSRGDVVPFRIAGFTSTFFPNSSAVYGLEDIRAHDPMANGRVLGVMRVVAGYTSNEYFATIRNFDSSLWDFLNVRYVISAPGEPLQTPGFEEIYSGDDARLYRNVEAMPRFFAARYVFNVFEDEERMTQIRENPDWANSIYVKWLPTKHLSDPVVEADLFRPRPLNAPMAKVAIRKVSGSRFLLDVDAPRWSLIASSQPDLEGWKITRNGTENLDRVPVNESFFGFLVPPGRSTIEVAYRPRAFYQGLYLALATALFLAAWGTLLRFGIVRAPESGRLHRLIHAW